MNVGATETLVRAAEAQPSPPRFVQASSNAVFGARNPHRHHDILTAESPDPRGRPVQRNQTRGRGTGARLEPSVGGAATRRRAQRRPERHAVQHGRVVLRELPAHRRTHAQCRRSRRRNSIRQCHDGRCRGRDPADRRRRLAQGEAGRCRSRPCGGPRLAGRAAPGSARKPGQRRRRLVRHRLDGSHPSAGSAVVSTLFVARHGRGDARKDRVEALPVMAARSVRTDVYQAAGGVLQVARQVCRSLGCYPCQARRTRFGQACS